VNRQSEHLSIAQIEEYGRQASAARPETAEWVEKHLADCPLCRGHVLDFQRTRFGSAKVNTVSTANCPSEDDLRSLAAGICTDLITVELTAHATKCDRCRLLLFKYIEEFSDELTLEQNAVLNGLNSATPKWQQQTARQMLNTAATSTADQYNSAPEPSTQQPVKSRRHSFSWKWVFVPAVVAICALIAFSIWYTQRETPEKVEKLLAEAYTEQRTIEMRWPGAEWAELREMRGPTPVDKPLPLLEATDEIQHQTPETLRGTEWLHLRAQSEILSGIPSKQLIEDLNKATQSQAASLSLMFDLAIANFRIGEVTHDNSYYLRSKMALDELLKSSPSNPVALFNRAIVEQRLQLRDPAIADFTKCLALEKDPAWSAEIREKIEKLQSLR